MKRGVFLLIILFFAFQNQSFAGKDYDERLAEVISNSLVTGGFVNPAFGGNPPTTPPTEDEISTIVKSVKEELKDHFPEERVERIVKSLEENLLFLSRSGGLASDQNVRVSLKKAIIDTKLTKTEEERAKLDDAAKKFSGANFGVAITYTHDLGQRSRIRDITLVTDSAGQQIVRVTKEKNDLVRVMLETHYFFNLKSNFLGCTKQNFPSKCGWGPFVAIQPGNQEIVEAIGAGIMWGFRRNPEKPESFNIGVGGIVDPAVKVLGDGVEENKSLPSGETEVRYKETSQGGAFLVFSYAF